MDKELEEDSVEEEDSEEKMDDRDAYILQCRYIKYEE